MDTTKTITTTRELNHGRQHVPSGTELQCTDADAAYYVTRNFATYNTREMVAAPAPAPVVVAAPAPARARAARVTPPPVAVAAPEPAPEPSPPAPQTATSVEPDQPAAE